MTGEMKSGIRLRCAAHETCNCDTSSPAPSVSAEDIAWLERFVRDAKFFANFNREVPPNIAWNAERATYLLAALDAMEKAE